jgi:hypothetical protein
MAPTLTVVTPFLPSEIIHDRYVVDKKIISAQIAHWFGNGPWIAGAAQGAARAIAEIRSAGGWICCDCSSPKRLDQQALLFPRATKTYSLIRGDSSTSGRHDHEVGCPFKKLRSAGKLPRAMSIFELDPRSTDPTLGFFRGGPKPVSKPNAPTSRPTSSGRPRVNAEVRRGLGSVMYSTIDAANLQYLDHLPRPHIDRQWAAVERALSQLMMFQGGPAALTFSKTNFKFDWVVRDVVERASAASWPKGLAPHGFLFDIVSELEEVSQTTVLTSTRNNRLTIYGAVSRPGRRTRGPWLAAVLVASPSKGVAPRAIQAYLHPIVNDNTLLLVDSGKERDTLDVLVTSLTEKRRSNQTLTWRIDKPVLDLHLGTDRVRPDFLVSFAGKISSVETMGFKHPEYLLRKQRLQAILASHYAFAFEHKPPDKGVFRDAFDHWLTQASSTPAGDSSVVS